MYQVRNILMIIIENGFIKLNIPSDKHSDDFIETRLSNLIETRFIKFN